jgi:hypothetical protein
MASGDALFLVYCSGRSREIKAIRLFETGGEPVPSLFSAKGKFLSQRSRNQKQHFDEGWSLSKMVENPHKCNSHGNRAEFKNG